MGLGKREIYVLILSKIVEETVRGEFTPYHILPLRGRLSISFVYAALNELSSKGYIETVAKGRRYVPGQHSSYLVSDKGNDLLTRFTSQLASQLILAPVTGSNSNI